MNRLAGRSLTASHGGVIKTFTFGLDLPDTLTANKRVLIATYGVAATGPRHARLRDARSLRRHRWRHGELCERRLVRLRTRSPSTASTRNSLARRERRQPSRPITRASRHRCPRARSPSSSSTTGRSTTTSSALSRRTSTRWTPASSKAGRAPGLTFTRPSSPIAGPARRRRRQSGLPLLHPAAARQLALLLRLARRLHVHPRPRQHRSQFQRLHPRVTERLLHRAAEHDDRRVPGRHRARVPALEPALRFQPPLHDRSGGQGADGRPGLRRGRLRARRGQHVREQPRSTRSAIPGVRRVAFRAGLRQRRRHRHAVPERRSGADARHRPDQSGQPDRRLAAGPLVGRRIARLADRILVRRRPHVGAHRGNVLALRRRQRGQWRRLRSRQRPVGHLCARRDGLPDLAVVQRRGKPAGLVQRHPRQPLRRPRPDMERTDHTDPRRAGGLQRQGVDHRRPDRRAVRLRDVGSPGRQPRPDLVWRARRTAARPGNPRARSSIPASTTRRSTTRSSCCPTARWSISSRGSIPTPRWRSSAPPTRASRGPRPSSSRSRRRSACAIPKTGPTCATARTWDPSP